MADICQNLNGWEIQGVKVEYDIHTKVAALLRTGCGALKTSGGPLFERHYDPDRCPKRTGRDKRKRMRRGDAEIKTISCPGGSEERTRFMSYCLTLHLTAPRLATWITRPASRTYDLSALPEDFQEILKYEYIEVL